MGRRNTRAGDDGKEKIGRVFPFPSFFAPRISPFSECGATEDDAGMAR